MNSPDLLRAAGEALYGERWQSPIARLLGVNDRTVRRWLAQGNAIPAGIWLELSTAAKNRGDALRYLAKKLDGAGR